MICTLDDATEVEVAVTDFVHPIYREKLAKRGTSFEFSKAS